MSLESRSVDSQSSSFDRGIHWIASALVRAIQTCITLNRRASHLFDGCFPQMKLDIFDLYDKAVAEHMNGIPVALIVDVGGGKHCRFVKYKNETFQGKIVCVDISTEEMRQNTDVDEKRTADITKTVPCANEEADLIVSSSVLEHLEALPPFIKECARALKKDGYFIHVFSCKLAPFALLNELLPRGLSKLLLALVFPGKSLGYPAFYNCCYPSAVKRLLASSGLELQRLVLSYSQSEYFDCFCPAYLVSSLYELVVQALGLQDLCAYALVVARKAAPENGA